MLVTLVAAGHSLSRTLVRPGWVSVANRYHRCSAKTASPADLPEMAVTGGADGFPDMLRWASMRRCRPAGSRLPGSNKSGGWFSGRQAAFPAAPASRGLRGDTSSGRVRAGLGEGKRAAAGRACPTVTGGGVSATPTERVGSHAIRTEAGDGLAAVGTEIAARIHP